MILIFDTKIFWKSKIKLKFAISDNAEIYRNNVSGNNYGIQSANLVNGHHHDMQMNNFGQADVTNGYGMNLKQEPDVNFWLEPEYGNGINNTNIVACV